MWTKSAVIWQSCFFGPPVSAYVPVCDNFTVVGLQPWDQEVKPSEKLQVQNFQDVRAKPYSAKLPVLTCVGVPWVYLLVVCQNREIETLFQIEISQNLNMSFFNNILTVINIFQDFFVIILFLCCVIP